MIADRYQSSATEPGTMPTLDWWAALMRGIDGPLGPVLDVGAAEGVMSLAALDAGADAVLGIGLHDDRMATAKAAAVPGVTFVETTAADFRPRHTFRTVVYSMMAHWLGADETRRFAAMASRNFAIVFRTANDHYAVPDNGTWFPTFEELDATISGVRTHEELLLTQDNGKEVWSATYRTDLRIEGETVWKDGVASPLRHGHDLHGDAPFRPTNGARLAELSQRERIALGVLAAEVARDALDSGWYPTDFSPRNVIVGPKGAFLIDPDYGPLVDGRVDDEFLPTWQATLSTVGLDFDGDLRSLL